MIVVTCASGQQASNIVPRLVSSGMNKLRLLVHTPYSAERLRSQYPDAEVVCVDLASPSACEAALYDATTIFLILPPFHSREADVGKNMVDAAVIESQRSGNQFCHFVFSSVIQTQLTKLLNHDVKRYVEEYLMESGLKYTILKPTVFFDNFVPSLRSLVRQATKESKPLHLSAPWNVDILFSEIALDDFGEVAFKVISEGQKHYFASYDLVSTMPQPWRKKVDILSEQLGCEIVVTAGLVQEVGSHIAKMSTKADKPDLDALDVAERMVLYYNRRGIIGNPFVLEMILGRKATTVQGWVEEQIEKARQTT